MPAEIERKWLVPQLPPQVEELSEVELHQGYLAISELEEVRLRESSNQWVLTHKRGHGLEREEVEVELTQGQFSQLWPATLGRRLIKFRRTLVWYDCKLEVDVYDGVLQDLIVAEVEFSSRQQAQEFTPPPWVGEEVTGDPTYSNQTLAH